MITFRELRWFRHSVFGMGEAKPTELAQQLLSDSAERRGPLSKRPEEEEEKKR